MPLPLSMLTDLFAEEMLWSGPAARTPGEQYQQRRAVERAGATPAQPAAASRGPSLESILEPLVAPLVSFQRATNNPQAYEQWRQQAEASRPVAPQPLPQLAAQRGGYVGGGTDRGVTETPLDAQGQPAISFASLPDEALMRQPAQTADPPPPLQLIPSGFGPAPSGAPTPLRPGEPVGPSNPLVRQGETATTLRLPGHSPVALPMDNNGVVWRPGQMPSYEWQLQNAATRGSHAGAVVENPDFTGVAVAFDSAPWAARNSGGVQSGQDLLAHSLGGTFNGNFPSMDVARLRGVSPRDYAQRVMGMLNSPEGPSQAAYRQAEAQRQNDALRGFHSPDGGFVQGGAATNALNARAQMLHAENTGRQFTPDAQRGEAFREFVAAQIRQGATFGDAVSRWRAQGQVVPDWVGGQQPQQAQGQQPVQNADEVNLRMQLEALRTQPGVAGQPPRQRTIAEFMQAISGDALRNNPAAVVQYAREAYPESQNGSFEHWYNTTSNGPIAELFGPSADEQTRVALLNSLNSRYPQLGLRYGTRIVNPLSRPGESFLNHMFMGIPMRRGPSPLPQYFPQ